MNDPYAGGGPRFTVGLIAAVAQVLEDHGYDRITGLDSVELRIHLFHFLHGDKDRSCQGGVR